MILPQTKSPPGAYPGRKGEMTMKNIEAFVDGVKKLAEQNGMGAIVEVKTVRTYDSFYDKNDNIFDSSDYWYEDIEVDLKGLLMTDYELRTDFALADIDFIYDLALELDEDMNPDTTLDQLKASFPNDFNNLMKQIVEEIKSMDIYDLEDNMEALFGVSIAEIDRLEPLAYWTVYFKPEKWDEETAWKCGLYPFYYKDEGYLALGGCGMDLSPKLDAYQAQTVHSIPSGSEFIKEPEYAQYVVGKAIFQKVMDAVKIDPEVHIRAY